MTLTNQRVAVLIEQQYQEMEVWYPVYRLREAGCEVTLVGPEAGKTYPSKLGYPAVADVAAKDVTADQFDAVVIPGGFAPDYIRRTEPMLKLVRDMFAQGKPVAAICHGPWVLCSTPALKGKTATVLLLDQGRRGERRRDVRRSGKWCADGNVITSRKPDDLPAFVVALMEAMGKG